MIEDTQQYFRILKLKPKPEWAEMWHSWTVVVPRRSITGRLVWRRAWRRHDGKRWIYKNYVEQND